MVRANADPDSEYDQLAYRVLLAMMIREHSYKPSTVEVSDYNGGSYTLPCGHYELSSFDAADKVGRDANERYLIGMLLVGCWNDIQDWAKVRGISWEDVESVNREYKSTRREEAVS